MILKQLLGEIMTHMGFVTSEQLDEALEKQRTLFEEKTLPEQLQRARLISEARLATDTTPLLGQILVEMEFATKEQLEEALFEQEKMVEAYKSLKSEKVAAAVEIGSIVNSTLNLAEVLGLIMRYVNRVTNSMASSLMLLDERTGELVLSVPTGPKAAKLTDMRIPASEGIAGWVVEHGQPVLVPDVKKDERFYKEVDRVSRFKTKSIVCVPLKAKTKLIGVLEVMNKVDGTSFTEEDVALMSIFAYQAAMAIENARLYSELKERLEGEIQLQKKLSESDKFRALGLMASGVAHDFNNLLMGIQGNTSLMLLDIDSSDPHHERLKNIEQSVQTGAELTRQLLGFTRGGKYEIKPTDLSELMEKTSRMFAPTKKEIRIFTKYQKGIWSVKVDQSQIEQVLLNLYVNAWQAMPSGGDLYLQTENVTLDNKFVRAIDIKPGKYVKMSVIDNGVGMDETTRKRLFDPFFTTKEMGRGTGLGLATAYGIIKNHGGYINVLSEKGEGTTFNIYLPVTEEKIVEEKKSSEKVLRGKERVLLVDDEHMILEVGKEMLAKMGYEVLTANSGKKALEIYRKKKDQIGIVILDMIMPEMGGGETYDKMKKINPGIKVLLSSGYSINGQATEILKRGCNAFIQKPFSVTGLSLKLREILDKK
ncbi:MAG: response regulator [Deltaproteobacteria bacterium]|nr:response regulator [Deltaproteobacteria bacterium]MBW2341797.1 response regulator [Deltaproteobacteria bacterium]